MNKETKSLKEALKNLIINNKNYSVEEKFSVDDIKKIFSRHIGFEKEKDKFSNYVFFYSQTNGNFYPKREIICYSGAPGTGKTSFVNTLAEALGRKLEIISFSGLKEFAEKSILGDEKKPSLAAWAMEKTGCKNPIILLDELEKVEEGSEIQKDLIKFFNIYKNEEKDESGKFFDKFHKEELDLNHVTFFATVNYPEKLSPLLKSKINMRILEDYNDEDKKSILRLKKKEIEEDLKKIYGNEIGEVIPEGIIEELPNYINESGVRQTERVLYKIKEKYIFEREKGRKFSLENPKQWLEENVLPYQESFSPRAKHYALFFLWGFTWILLLLLIIKIIITKEEKNNSKEKFTENE
ncbi:MAG: Lon protease [Mycoplasmataceae bacterium]|nr:MAG: Lon protease [Mycoplasmataceae bacterium]